MMRGGAWPLFGLLAVGACQSKSAQGPTGAQIEIATETGTPLPTSIELVWLDGSKQLRQWRVPEAGELSPGEAGAVSVFVDVEPSSAGPRRVIARGFNGSSPISEGAERLTVPAAGWVTVRVTLAAGSLPDRDGDGVPDKIDDCPAQFDPCSPVDASAVDTRPGPETAGRDGPDGGPNPPDDRPQDLRPDVPPDIAGERPPFANGNGTGLKGEYYDDKVFTPTLLKLTRLDVRIDFNWGTTSPAPTIDSDSFSVRWTGQVQPRYSDTYTFYVSYDDGVRLWVNGQMLINDFVNGPQREKSGKIDLLAGQKYDIRLEYFESTGPAACQLFWSSFWQAREIVPTSQLYPAAFGDGGM